MSLFCGNTCKCKRRCEAGFPNDKALREGCRDVCRSGDTDVTPDLYLSQYVQQAAFIQNSGYDPDPFDQVDLCSLPGAQFDPLCQQADTSNYTPFILAGFALVAILIFFIAKR